MQPILIQSIFLNILLRALLDRRIIILHRSLYVIELTIRKNAQLFHDMFLFIQKAKKFYIANI